jgi:hypothetical protein
MFNGGSDKGGIEDDVGIDEGGGGKFRLVQDY